MAKTKINSVLFAVLFAVASSAQTPTVQKEDKNAPHPSFDIGEVEASANQHYRQGYRPQYHYTPIQGFVGDATGLIYNDGTYHLFYMSDKWERRKNRNKRWGYATSKDLLHWEEKPSILDPIQDHKPGSGSGIVDYDNVLGLATGKEKTLVVFYTDYKTGSCIIYSTDGGETWTRHPRNPVLPRVGSNDRDPTVFWYAPAKEWRMIRHGEPFDEKTKTGFVIFGSKNLLDWTYLSRLDDFNECPDIFELPVQGERGTKKWVLMDAGYNYFIGNFDGTQFIRETEKLRMDNAASKYVYAPQTWKKTRDGRTPPVQMGFLHYPKGADLMPARLTWHGQMTFPMELSLKRLNEGLRVCREPIKDIKKLYVGKKSWRPFTLRPGENPLSDVRGETLDIQLEIDLSNTTALTFNIRGQNLRYTVANGQLDLEGSKATVRSQGKRLRLRALVDRSSIEIFADEGQVSFSRLFFFDPANTQYSLTVEGGEARVASLSANLLKSIWGDKGATISKFATLQNE